MNGVMSNPRVLLLLLIHRPAGPDIAFGQNKILLAPALDQTALGTTSACVTTVTTPSSVYCKDFGHCLHPCLSPILSVVGARVVGAHDDEHVLELGSANKLNHDRNAVKSTM